LTDVLLRIGKDGAFSSVWYRAGEYGISGSELEVRREIGRRWIEGSTRDSDAAFARLSGIMTDEIYGSETYVRHSRNAIETQDIDLVLRIMNGLVSGQEVAIQYGGDVAKIVPNQFFLNAYPQVKRGCAY
jgi:hypothetical protein